MTTTKIKPKSTGVVHFSHTDCDKPSLQKRAKKAVKNSNKNGTTKINTSLNLNTKPIVKLNKVEDIKTELHLVENFVNECKFNNLTGTKIYNILVKQAEELRFKNYLIINNLTHVS